ncbi:hypothetical protein [Actinoallomurus sp. NPDC050550]|uniref:hypothetical protein n=1 Tax=Actinoallomurus sp. NPDC050550 TaxID=3154937 RepID=UPI00340DC01F
MPGGCGTAPTPVRRLRRGIDARPGARRQRGSADTRPAAAAARHRRPNSARRQRRGADARPGVLLTAPWHRYSPCGVSLTACGADARTVVVGVRCE